MNKRFAILAAAWLVLFPFLYSAHSAAIPIVFDNVSGIDNNLVWVQFLGGSNVSGHFYDINGAQQPLTANTAYSLASLISMTSGTYVPGQQGSPTLWVDSVNSGRVYISYGLEGLQGMGTPGGPYTPAVNASTDPNYLTRYQYFELTVNDGQITSDLSYIDFTAVSFSMLAQSAPNASNGTQTSQAGQTLVNAAAAVALSPNLNVIPGAAAVLPSPEFARVIGPGYEISVNNQPPQQVYRDFSAYLNSLDGNKELTLAGLFAGVGQSTDPSLQQQMYNFTASFTGTVASGGSVTLTAVTTPGIASGDGQALVIPHGNRGTGVGSNNSITLTYAELNAVTGIYGADPKYTVTVNGVAQPTTAGLVNDFYGWVVGDLLAGFSLGYVGSTKLVGNTGPAIGTLASSGWWGGGIPTKSNPGITQYVPGTNTWIPVQNKTTPAALNQIYSSANSNSTHYNIYANALTGPGTPLTDGYAFPFGDRLGANLLSFDVDQDPNAYLQFQINADTGTAAPTYVWDSGENTANWGDSGNWNPNKHPSHHAFVEFGTGSQTSIDLGANRIVGGIFFNPGSESFTLTNTGGFTLTLEADSTTPTAYYGYVVNNSTNMQTIAAEIVLNTNANFSASVGNLNLASIDLSTYSATFSGNGPLGAPSTLTVSGTLTGTGGITKTGLSTLILEGTNSNSGTVELLAGTLQLNHNASAGTGTFELAGGSLQAGSSSISLANAISFGSTTSEGSASLVGILGAEAITFTGPVTVNGPTTLSIASGSSLELQGLLSSPSSTYSLTQTGAGTLTIAGSTPNTFAGLLAVNQGTLVLNNSVGPAFKGNLTIGAGSPTTTATVNILAANQAPTASGNGTATLTINRDGVLSLGTNTLDLLALNLNGGSVTGVGSTLAFAGGSTSFLTFAGPNSTSSNIASGLQLNGGVVLNINPNQAAAQVTVTGNLTGSGSLAKNHDGTVIFTGSNTGYTGAVTLNAGILGANDFSGSAVTLNQGGTFSPGAIGVIQHATLKTLTLQGGSLLFDLGTGGASDKITIGSGGNLYPNSPTTFIFNDAGFTSGSATFDLLTGPGVSGITLSSLSFASLNIAGMTGTFQFDVTHTTLQFAATAGQIASWTGATNGAWSQGTNWNPSGVPATGADIEFNTSANTSIDLSASPTSVNPTVGSMTFKPGADAFTISNNTITLGGNLTNDSTNLQTINSNLTLNYSRSIIAQSGGFNLGTSSTVIALSNGSLANTLTFNVNTGQTVAVAGNIQNLTTPLASTDLQGSLVKTGAGKLILSGTNTFSGSLIFEEGVVSISSINNLGANQAGGNSIPTIYSTLIFDGGTLEATNNVIYAYTRPNITLQSGGATFDVDSGFTLTLEAALVGTGGITKIGDGTLALARSASNSTYTGPLEVTAGTVTFDSAGEFGSTSGVSVTGSGALKFSSNMSIAPALTLGSTGNATTTGAINLQSANVGFQGAITLNAATSIVIGGTSTVDFFSSIFNAGNSFTLAGDGSSGNKIVNIHTAISGSGALILNNNTLTTLQTTSQNTFTGGIQIQGGNPSASILGATLNVTANGNLANTSGNIQVASGGSLQFNLAQTSTSSTLITVANNLQLAGAGVGAVAPGAIYNLLGLTTFTGSVTLNGATTIAAASGGLSFQEAFNLGANNLTFNLFTGSGAEILGSLSGSGSLTLPSTSAGQLTLGGDNNSFTGTITVNGGSILATNAGALGSGTITVANNTALVLQTSGANTFSSSSQSVNLAGTGINTTGALRSLAGQNTFAGAISASAGTFFQVDAGSLTLSHTLTLALGNYAFTAVDAKSTLNVSGSISGGIIGTPLAISIGNQSGTPVGTVNLSGDNSALYSTVNLFSGTLEVGASAMTKSSLVMSSNTTLSPGKEGTVATVAVKTLTPAAHTTFIFDIGATADQISFTGGLNLGNLAITFQLEQVSGFAGAGTYTILTGTGAIFADTANFANITINSSAIPGYTFTVANGATNTSLVLNATGSGPVAATWVGGGPNGDWSTPANWQGNTVPTSGSAITFGGTSQLAVNPTANQTTGAITFDATAGQFVIDSATPLYSLTVNGDITNNSADTQTINSTVIFTKSQSIDAASGALTFQAIQINSSSTTARTVTFTGANGIAVTGIISDTATAHGNLAIDSTGTVTLTGANTFTGTVTLTSGTLAIHSAAALGNGSATNTLIFDGGTLQATGTVTTSATSGITLESTGLVALNGQAVTFGGVISGTGGLTTTGTGTFTLSGANQYTGVTTLGTGAILSLANNSALGASSNTIIQSGAALQLQNALSVGARPLSLAGTGVGGNGALRNLSGANTFGGPITLTAASTIQADADSLALTGGLTNGGFTLSFAPKIGAAITASGDLTGTGGVTMAGPGTVTLSGANNTYTGNTSITQGTLASSSLTGSTVTLNGGKFSPGAMGTIALITVKGLTLDGGDLLFDLGAGTSDLITIGTGTALLTSATNFFFSSVNYTPGTFTLLTGTGVSLFAPDLGLLTAHSSIPGFSGHFHVHGDSLQFISGSSTGSTWTGTISDDWNVAGNWNPSGIPATGTNLTFGASSQLTVDTQTNQSVGSITFSTAATGAYSIENNTLTLTGNLTNQSTYLQTITSGLTLAADLTVSAASGDLQLTTIQLTNSNAARTLTFDGASDTTVTGVISDGGTHSNLVKNGEGTVTFDGLNTYSGTTTLNAGIVAVGSSNALGDGSATNTLIFNGGTLQATATLSLPATTGSTRGIELTGAGFIDSHSFDVDVATTISGVGALGKLGDGTLTLTGDNTYQNVTAIHQGIVNIQSNTALGSIAAGTAVAGGAALELEGGVTVGAEALALNGSGINQTGALRSVSGANTFGGAITLGTAAEIQVDLNSLALTGTINLGSNLLTTDTDAALTIAGVISGSGGLTKEGAATLTLTGNNSFTGTTTVSEGLLQVGNGGTSGSLTGALVNNSQIEFNRSSNSIYGGVLTGNGTLAKLGAGTLSLTGNTTAFTGTTTISAGTLQIGNGGSTGSISGNMVNNSALAFNRSGNVTYGGDISGTGGVSVLGTGIVTLTGANNYTGATSITQGTLASGDLTSDVTVNGGGFSPGGSGVIDSITVASLTLAGGDLIFDLGTGTSDLITATNMSTNMSLTGHTVFVFNSVSFAPGTFTLLSGTGVSAFNLSLLSFNSSIAGLTGSFSQGGVGNNDLLFTASITQNSTWDGGAGTGDWNTALNWASDTIPGNNADITFAGTTQTNVNTQTPQTIGSLDFEAGAGEFVIGTDTLTVSRDITNSSGVTQTINSNIQLTGSITKTAASGDLIFGGNIALSPNATIRTLTFDGGDDITVQGVISNGGTATSGHLVKNGTGTLTLNGANTYSGTTTVNGGILAANSSSALGDGSATNTLILNNATLLATGNINSPTTRGITLEGPATLNSGGFNLTLAGAITGSNALSKTGTGSLILTAANTGYTGTIAVQAGTLNLQNNSALGTGSAGVTVSNGAALELQSGISIASKGLTLNGLGVSGNGALRNVSGTNTYGGAITLASASEIQVDAGTLTLSAGANLGAFNLTTDVTGTLAVSGTLAGTGGVNKTSAGTLIYTNANTYTGVTTVSAGTLQIGNGGTAGSLAGSLTNHAAVVLNRSDSLTFANAMSGTGTFTKSGNNHVTLTGNNSFTGLTTISGGILQVGAGGTTGSLTGPISNGGTLIFNRSDTLTYNGAVSGGGSLTQTGTGTLILGGASAYTGNTVISTGALRAANSTALGSTSGGTTVANGAALELADNVAIGAEALSVQGTGVGGNGAMRNISGQNSYGGAVTLGGNTTFGSDAGLLQVVNQITNNGHALTVNATGGNVGISGGLVGTGSLIKTGAGTLNLSTANTYSGGTTLNAGTLAASNAGALGTGTTNLNGGALAATGTVNASTFNWAGGQISLDLAGANLLNATDFNRVGTAPLTFTLSNASEGIFTLVTFTNQTGFNVADFTANFVGDDFFDFAFALAANSVQLTLTANVQTGPDLNNGEGVSTTANFIVNGNVTTFGPVFANVVNSLTFMPGSVLFFDNNTVSVTTGNMTLVPGAPSIVNGSGTFFFPNGFNLLGGGALNVQIPVQVTGQTNVNADTTLYVNSTWTTDQLNILSGGALFGAGTINGNVINNGNVNPGNSPGTLTINGNFTQASTGTFTLEIASATNFDRLIVNGTANLNGNLQVSVLDGYALSFGQQFAFIDAFSIDGEFSSINGLPDGFRGRLIEQGNDLVLLIAPVDYRVVAQTQNQRNVAGALNGFISATSGDRETVSIALDQLSAAAYPAAFDAIAPGYYETLTDIIVQQNNTLGQTMTQQLSSARNGAPGFRTSGIELLPVDSKQTKDETKDQVLVPSKDNRWGIWTMATGIFATATSVNNLPNYRFDTGGVIVGVDFRWNPAFVTGLYAGYQYTMADYGGDGGSTRINTFNFGGYATWQPTPGRGFYVDGIIGGGVSDYRVQRPIEFGTVDRSAVSKPQGGNLTSVLNVGYDWQAGGFTFGPIASAQYTYAAVGGFTETGADSLNLRVNSYGANSLVSSLGGRVAYTWKVSSKVAIVPEARLLWQHEFLQNPTQIGAALDGGSGAGFDWTTAAPARDSVYAGLGATFQFGEHLNFNLYYNADFGANDYIGHSVTAGLRLKF